MADPSIGKTIEVNDVPTNFLEEGRGDPLVFIHGGGPGVTAWANWSMALPWFGKRFRALAYDVIGFGHSGRHPKGEYSLDLLVDHLLGFLDALSIDRVCLIGNSMGGLISLASAMRHPNRIQKMVLMGAPGAGKIETKGVVKKGVEFEPSLQNMRSMLSHFAYDPTLVTDELVEHRHRISQLPGSGIAFKAVAATVAKGFSDDQIRAVQVPTLIIHGREDLIVPVDVAVQTQALLPNADLHVLAKCGHWTQLDCPRRFYDLVSEFILGDKR